MGVYPAGDSDAPVVKWIERRFPKPLIRVRFPAGVQILLFYIMNITEKNSVVVRFSGDSGDGMQLAGNIFSTVSATVGNSISTFPDYPADIRAPQGSLTGVSGFQVHIGASQV